MVGGVDVENQTCVPTPIHWIIFALLEQYLDIRKDTDYARPLWKLALLRGKS
jgi:hypothetical protein